jgi:hypothetical protein
MTCFNDLLKEWSKVPAAGLAGAASREIESKCKLNNLHQGEGETTNHLGQLCKPIALDSRVSKRVQYRGGYNYGGYKSSWTQSLKLLIF